MAAFVPLPHTCNSLWRNRLKSVCLIPCNDNKPVNLCACTFCCPAGCCAVLHASLSLSPNLFILCEFSVPLHILFACALPTLQNCPLTNDIRGPWIPTNSSNLFIINNTTITHSSNSCCKIESWLWRAPLPIHGKRRRRFYELLSVDLSGSRTDPRRWPQSLIRVLDFQIDISLMRRPTIRISHSLSIDYSSAPWPHYR